MSATTDMTNPAIVPIAKSNQNTSEGPSKRKGTRPMTEDTIVRNMGIILELNDLT